MVRKTNSSSLGNKKSAVRKTAARRRPGSASDAGRAPISSNYLTQPSFSGDRPKANSLKPTVLVLGFLILLLAVAYFFRDKYLAAIVNNRPIFRYQLNQKMVKTVGNEFMENMIIEELIRQEAKKQGVVVMPADVAAEVDRLSQSLGEGVEIEDALKFQGLTMEEFRSQLETRLLVDRILGKQVAITAAEVDTFLKDNSELLTATAEAERRSEAEGRIKEEKISQLVQGWVSDLRQQAKIQRFLPGSAL